MAKKPTIELDDLIMLWTMAEEYYKQQTGRSRLNQADIARKTGISTRTLSDWFGRRMFPREGSFRRFLMFYTDEDHRKVLLNQWEIAKCALEDSPHGPLYGDDPTDTAPPHRNRRWAIIGLAVAGVLAALAGAVAWLRDPQPQCATVVAKPSAPVYLEIGEPPLKTKRYGERVELYPALEPVRRPEGTYQAVIVREPINTYGWMLDAHLDPVTCHRR